MTEFEACIPSPELGNRLAVGVDTGVALRPFNFAGLASFDFFAAAAAGAAFAGFAEAAFRALAAAALLPLEAGFVAFVAEAGFGFAVDLAGLDLAIGKRKNGEGETVWKN